MRQKKKDPSQQTTDQRQLAKQLHFMEERQSIRRFLQKRQRIILRSLGLYLLISAIWIYTSDYYLFILTDYFNYYQVSLIKGWFFVGFSTLFFVILLHQRRLVYEKAIDTLDQQEHSIDISNHADPLTRLPTRQYLEEEISRRISSEKEDEVHFGLLYLDIDDFRLANEMGGYTAGNSLLIYIADTLQLLLRPGDLAVHLAADEFAVLIDPVSRGSDLLNFGDRFRDRLHHSWQIDSREYFLSLSIGAAIWPLHGNSSEQLLQHAEQAMLNSKAVGKNCTSLFYPGIRSHAGQKTAEVTALRLAIEENRFCIQYQPQFDLLSGKLRGLEALLRQIAPDGELILPDHFIALAESTGLIDQLTSQVIRDVYRHTTAWHENGLLPPVISINISSIQLQQDDLPDLISPLQKALADLGCQLELEITEGVLLEQPEQAINLINELKKIGLDFALDDFGTGFSSLTWLRQLPADVVKIDRTFIQTMLSNSRDAEIVRSIVDLSHNIGLAVIAEGIETTQQLHWLREIGCDYGQGYLMALPCDGDVLSRILSAGRMPANLLNLSGPQTADHAFLK